MFAKIDSFIRTSSLNSLRFPELFQYEMGILSDWMIESKILTSKTILFDQPIDGNMISRPVIIKTCAKIDNLKSYPIVIALHGRGGSNKNWVQPLSKFTNSGEFIGVYPQAHVPLAEFSDRK